MQFDKHSTLCSHFYEEVVYKLITRRYVNENGNF